MKKPLVFFAASIVFLVIGGLIVRQAFADVVAPSTYNAITDNFPRPAITAPTLGAAGTFIIDPDFGTRVMRVTDQNTDPQDLNTSFYSPAGPNENDWNTSSTMVWVGAPDGATYIVDFDPVNFISSIMKNPSNPSQDFYLPVSNPAWSFQNPNYIYGIGGSDGHSIMRYDFGTNTLTQVVNLDTLVNTSTWPSAPWYAGLVSVDDTDTYFSTFVGDGSNQGYDVIVYDAATGQDAILDAKNSQFKAFGSSTYTPLSQLLGNGIHSVDMDRTGRYLDVSLEPGIFTGPNNGPTASDIYWDDQAGTLTPLTADSSGHEAFGFGVVTNECGDIPPQTEPDANNWCIRNLSDPNSSVAQLAPVPNPPYRFGDRSGHLSWNNAQNGSMVPVLDSQDPLPYTDPGTLYPWRADDGEIIAIATDGSGVIWRFAHTWTWLTTADYESISGFWNESRADISQDGKFALFTSNWQDGLGIDTTQSPQVPRTDAFIVELDQRYPGTSPPTDQTPPSSATFIEPTPSSNATVAGTIALNATATDNVGVTEINYLMDGIPITDLSSTSCQTFDTTQTTDGNHLFQIVAVDAANNASVLSSLTLHVNNATGIPTEGSCNGFTPATTPPVISSILSSAAGQTSETITWTTNSLSNSQVDFGPDDTYGSASSLDSSLVTSHSVTLTGLNPNNTYHYRVESEDSFENLTLSADDVFTTGSSGTVPSGSWYDPAWAYRKELTINQAEVSSTLSDFPVLVDVTDQNLQNSAKIDGSDIVFTDADNNILNYEISEFNQASGALEAWVSVPTLSDATDTVIYMYYGNPSATDRSNKTGTWDSHYMGVWHLDAGFGGLESLNDSTVNGNTLSAGDTTAATGIIGGGSSNPGTNPGGLTVVSPNNLYGLTSFTYSVWVNPATLTNTRGDGKIELVNIGSDDLNFSSANGVLTATVPTNGTYRSAISTNALVPSAWQYVVETYASGTAPKIYVNGDEVSYSLQNAGTGADTVQNNGVGLGVSGNNVYSGDINGVLDEARISGSARSGAWIRTEYDNQSDPSSFMSVGSQESYQTSSSGEPVILDVEVSEVTSNGATITWTTDVPATSSIAYGLSTAYGSGVSDLNVITSHDVTLSGLSASTLYHFAVTAYATSTSNTSGDGTFTTRAGAGSSSAVVVQVASNNGVVAPGSSSVSAAVGNSSSSVSAASITTVATAEPGGSGNESPLLIGLLAELQALVEKLGTALVAEVSRTLLTPPSTTTSAQQPSTFGSTTTKSGSLYLGEKGSAVTALQDILLTDGYLSPGTFASGTFDQATENAVEALQCVVNITCSGPGYGIVGPKTSAYLSAHQ